MSQFFLIVTNLIWSSLTWIRRLLLTHVFPGGFSLPGTRVISVGNLQAGGAGKTPFVAWLAHKAIDEGFSVVIVTRGYRSLSEKIGGMIPPQDFRGNLIFTAERVGDEPLLLSQLVPRAWISIGQKRVKHLKNLMQQKGIKPDFIILDDGFQNFQFKKTKEVLLVTSMGFSKTYHRDFLNQAKYADLVIWTKGTEKPSLKELQISESQFYQVRFENKINPTSQSMGQPIWLVSGVGEPAYVRLSLEQQGYEVEQHFCYPDHAFYQESNVRELIRRARTANRKIVLTGKDAVKWESLGISLEDMRDVQVVEPKLIFESAQLEAEVWNKIKTL